MQTIVILTKFNWGKGSTLAEALSNAKYDGTQEIIGYAINCDKSEVSVNDMGGVSWPATAVGVPLHDEKAERLPISKAKILDGVIETAIEMDKFNIYFKNRIEEAIEGEGDFGQYLNK